MLIGVCLVFIVVVIIIIIAIFWWLSYWTVFCPSRVMIWQPDSTQTPYLDLYLPLAKDRAGEVYGPCDQRPQPCINAWYFYAFNKVNKRGHCPSTVLYFHGNSGNMSHRDYVIDICRRLNLNLLLIDYQGYGRSDNIVSPDSIYRDGEVAYRYLSGQVNCQNIIIWGESLGSTVACYIAARYKCRALIILAGFSSLDDVIINCGFPDWTAKTFSNIMRRIFHSMESKQYLSTITCPVAIMHSKTDSLIPYQCGVILFNSVPHPQKMFFEIKGDHASPNISDQTLKTLLAFVDVQAECMDNNINYICNLLKEVCRQQPGLLPDKFCQTNLTCEKPVTQPSPQLDDNLKLNHFINPFTDDNIAINILEGF